MSEFEAGLSIVLGIALAASTGFRVFVPLLITSVAAHFGHVELGSGFAWLATIPAMTMLGVATLAEVLAYSIPAVDNLLDVIAAPAALIAGTVLTAAVMTDLPPGLKWSVAVIAGGGAAGLTQSITTLLRAKSTLFTGGVANPALSIVELASASLVPVLALLAPIVALLLLVVVCALAVRFVRR